MKDIFWAWAIKNSIVVICFTTLAIVSGKWWIALFALFFMSDLRRPQKDDAVQKLERERDALLEIAEKTCQTCKHGDDSTHDCRGCSTGSKWEWRGL